MISSAAHLAIFSLVLAVSSALLVSMCGAYYLRRVRLERPAIGTFNGRDVLILFCLLSTIPLFYLTLPRWLLTGFLLLTFSAALSIGLGPLLPPAQRWILIGGLLGANLWMGTNLLGTVVGWQAFWIENDVIVLLGAVFVANLYIQGGMQLRHVAWFALALAVYDTVFTAVYPVTNTLVEAFLGYPLDPSIGIRWGFDNAAIGIGDLLVYGLFMLAAFKGYGRRAWHLATSVVLVFGAAVPALVPLLINYVDARTDTLVPAQFWFGPAAFLTYLWLRRQHGVERTMREFVQSDDAVRRPTASAEEPVWIPTGANVPRSPSAEGQAPGHGGPSQLPSAVAIAPCSPGL